MHTMPSHSLAASLDADAIAAIVAADHGDPFAVLGPHAIGDDLWEIRAMLPQASAATLLAPDGTELAVMERCHPAGFYVGRIAAPARPDYRLRVETPAGALVQGDTYAFGPLLSDSELAGLTQVGSDAPYRVLGAHRLMLEGQDGFRFAVWAPDARHVAVVGDFNGWDGRRHPMRLRHQAGVWELFIPGLEPGSRYKYEIKGPDGSLLPLKADPVAFRAEHPPATASLLHGLPGGAGRFAAGLPPETPPHKAPISIYECHLGSWARVPEEGDRYLTYDELSDRLIPYVKDLGFTHIELLPITEYPFDGSWGYQPISLFAPTGRFGTPEDFAAFVDAAHEAGLGVLLDWVPGHFPRDPHGLAEFDGTHLYEHADPRQGLHQDWDTAIYNFGRAEVSTFLVASARLWLERYRLDGLRVDAVASMLYLDYSRQPGDWVPNRHGGRENLEAIAFLQRLNETVYGARPDIFTVAEESTAWAGVSHPVSVGGLGFGFKWNMGWMHDTLRYMAHDPIHRRFHHDDLTFGLLYAFSENFILPLSHDEVVHGKGSLIGRMPGDAWQRFANLRAYYGFMWGHPGKKLLFMGGEFAQEREWNHDASLDWHLLGEPAHAGIRDLVADLNRAYRALPALHQRDCQADGFEWLVGDDRDNSILAFARRGDAPGALAVVVSNFTPMPRPGYRIGVPAPGRYREAINTDAACYGGSNMGNLGGVDAERAPSHGRDWSITVTVPPLATLIFALEG